MKLLKIDVMNKNFLKTLVYFTFIIVIAKFAYHFYSLYVKEQFANLNAILNGLIMLIIIGFAYYYNKTTKDNFEQNI
ncbi:MAG: hypothetical protein ABS44_12385 [Chryseobacterium sp. SCN 40-13]|nr:MAG: hypothetical protein ABS44_12385 [Chryseobacterium sp. SCN 40-13]